MIIGVLVVLSLAWVVLTAQDLAAAGAARQQTLDLLVHQYAELYEQAEEEGVNPDTPEPSEIAEQVVPTQGLTGARGDMGEPGRTGPQGEPGATGEPGPSGATGASGPSGSAGANGEPGPAGPQGPAGADGAAGPAGADGAPGPTCPDGSTLVEAWVLAADDEAGIPTARHVVFCETN